MSFLDFWALPQPRLDAFASARQKTWLRVNPLQKATVVKALQGYVAGGDQGRGPSSLLFHIAHWCPPVGAWLAAQAARQVLPLCDNATSVLLAIESTERWVRGEATAEECEQAGITAHTSGKGAGLFTVRGEAGGAGLHAARATCPDYGANDASYTAISVAQCFAADSGARLGSHEWLCAEALAKALLLDLIREEIPRAVAASAGDWTSREETRP